MKYTLKKLMQSMTERQALDFMQRERQSAIDAGKKVVRIIIGGKVTEQIIGHQPWQNSAKAKL